MQTREQLLDMAEKGLHVPTLQLSVLLDCRDLLQKLVEKKERPVTALCGICRGFGKIPNPDNPHDEVRENVVRFNYISCPSCSPVSDSIEA